MLEAAIDLWGLSVFLDPATGQGLNMTFEDAAELGWHVQQLGLTPEALRAYELERIPRVGVIVQKAEVRA